MSELERVCVQCRAMKPATDFRDRANRDSIRYREKYCRECQCVRYRLRWANRTEEQKKAAREKWTRGLEKRRQLGLKGRSWGNPEELRTYNREYARLAQDTPRVKARNKVRWAIKSGGLVRPARCGECSREGKPHAHHADYSKPLDVEWLCARCHGKRHTIEAELKQETPQNGN